MSIRDLHKLDRRKIEELALDWRKIVEAVSRIYSIPSLQPSAVDTIMPDIHLLLIVGRALSDSVSGGDQVFRGFLSVVLSDLFSRELRGMPVPLPKEVDPDEAVKICVSAIEDCYRTRCMPIREIAVAVAVSSEAELMNISVNAEKRCMALVARAVAIALDWMFGSFRRVTLPIRRRRRR